MFTRTKMLKWSSHNTMVCIAEQMTTLIGLKRLIALSIADEQCARDSGTCSLSLLDWRNCIPSRDKLCHFHSLVMLPTNISVQA